MSKQTEAIAKVKAFVEAEFAGDYQIAFDNYKSGDGLVHKNGLVAILRDSDVGTWFTRDIYAHEALNVLDLNRDGGISREEFQAALDKGD